MIQEHDRFVCECVRTAKIVPGDLYESSFTHLALIPLQNSLDPSAEGGILRSPFSAGDSLISLADCDRTGALGTKQC
jgi:hypothetical protein